VVVVVVLVAAAAVKLKTELPKVLFVIHYAMAVKKVTSH
jgi:hypothetical protein